MKYLRSLEKPLLNTNETKNFFWTLALFSYEHPKHGFRFQLRVKIFNKPVSRTTVWDRPSLKSCTPVLFSNTAMSFIRVLVLYSHTQRMTLDQLKGFRSTSSFAFQRGNFSFTDTQNPSKKTADNCCWSEPFLRTKLIFLDSLLVCLRSRLSFYIEEVFFDQWCSFASDKLLPLSQKMLYNVCKHAEKDLC